MSNQKLINLLEKFPHDIRQGMAKILPAIPLYNVVVYHPEYGWQVVNTAYTYEAAETFYIMWEKIFGPNATSIRKATGDQTWSVIK